MLYSGRNIANLVPQLAIGARRIERADLALGTSTWLRRLGIEIEVEYAMNLNEAALQKGIWTIADDGSLRHVGVELISRPLTLHEMLDAVHTLYTNWVHILGVRAQATQRTGVHVHVEVQDLTLEELASVVGAYSLVEPALFELAGPDREINIYCIPWYMSDTALYVQRQIVNYDPGAFLPEFHTCKYEALNFLPIHVHGTIEFRHARTFTSYEDCHKWIRACHNVVNNGCRYTLDELCYQAQNDLPELVRQILGHDQVVPGAIEKIEEINTVDLLTELLAEIEDIEFTPLDDEEATCAE